MTIPSTARLFLVCCICFGLSSCGQGGSGVPTETEVISLIREALELPKGIDLQISDIKKGTPLGKEITRMIKEDGLTENDKGKNKDNVTYFHDTGHYFHFRAYTHSQDVSEIKEILVDSEQGMATVTFVIESTPLPYLDELLAIDETKLQKSLKSKAYVFKTREKTIALKKWDQGWRVVGQ